MQGYVDVARPACAGRLCEGARSSTRHDLPPPHPFRLRLTTTKGGGTGEMGLDVRRGCRTNFPEETIGPLPNRKHDLARYPLPDETGKRGRDGRQITRSYSASKRCKRGFVQAGSHCQAKDKPSGAADWHRSCDAQQEESRGLQQASRCQHGPKGLR
jgi:hypothetical protein